MDEESVILIGGDFYPGGRIGSLIKENDLESIFNDTLPIIQASDFALINLESPLVEGGVTIRKFGPHLKGPPETMRILFNAGFKLVTLANNHIMDYGVDGLKSTIDLCDENSIGYVGAGCAYEERIRPYFCTIRGKRVGFLNIAENEYSVTSDKSAGSHPLNPIKNSYLIKDTAKKCEYLFVIVHGGHENYSLPSPDMKETFRFFANAGASAIICHHAHCFSGYEIYNNVPIFYGIGNLVFDNPTKSRSPWNEGFFVQFHLGTTLGFRLIPYNQCDAIPGVHLKSDSEQVTFQTKLKVLNDIIQNNQDLNSHFIDFCSSVANMYNGYLEPHSSRLLYFLQRKGLLPSFLRQNKKLLLRNLITCESHRAVLTELLSR
jgi:poly-gamma-glutamate synthesis protein (capsule biosynthesis protein)